MRPLAFLPLAFLPLAPAAAAPDPALAAQLQARTQALVDGIATGDKALWDAALDPAVVYVTEDDKTLTKAEVLAGLAPLPEGLSGQIRVAGYRLERFGPLAIATYTNVEALDYHGQLVRTRFRVTDSWMLKGAAWVLVATQSMAVLDDPPAVSLPAASLDQYVGQYELTFDIHYRIGVTGGRIYGQRQGGKPVELKAEAEDIFFIPGSPRGRKVFLRDADGKVSGMADRREGHDIVWKKIQ